MAALLAGCGSADDLNDGGSAVAGVGDRESRNTPPEGAPGVPEECLEVFPSAFTAARIGDVELLPAAFPEPPVAATLCETGGTIDQGQEYAGYASDAPEADVLAGYESALSAYGASITDDGVGRSVVNAQVGEVAVQVQPRDGGYRIVFAR